METRFNFLLVLLSVLVAVLASYAALNLAHSLTQAKGRARLIWLPCGALAMGMGIWSMHFVGMLAFEMPGMTMAYDIPLMILSVLVAVGASALALHIVSQPVVPLSSIVSGGVAMAAAIAGMHYIGMFSMRMDARIEWDLFLVVASVGVALVASFAGLGILVQLRDRSDQFFPMAAASLFIGLAIAGMHYTGMIAATFIHVEGPPLEPSDLAVSSELTVSVIAVTLLVLGLALAGSIGTRVVNRLKKRSAKALSKSEARYRALVEAIKDYAIFMLDIEGNIKTWNVGAETLTGYFPEEVIGKNISLFFTEEDNRTEFPTRELKTTLQQGHFETEGLRLRKDGSTFWANVVLTPLYDEEEKVSGYSVVTRDITRFKEDDERSRKIQEALEARVESRTRALQRQETQLRLITNSLPILIAQVDNEQKFLFANDAFCKWFGRTQENIIGHTFLEMLGEERYPANEPYIIKALSGEITHYERLSVSGDLSAALGITFVPEFGSQGEVVGFILVATDITRHKEIEAELKAAKEAAEVANTTKSAFLANMSHEIRTPLGAVLGFSELMMNDQLSEAERTNNMEIIKRNGRLLSNIINDILDLSKVEAGKLEVERVAVTFSEVMNELSSVLRLEATEKGIHLKVHSAGRLPQTIHTDPLRLRQILLNIVGNAIKFTEKGSVEIEVSVTPLNNGRHQLRFIVRDTGEGISPEQAARLFKPFTQADTSTTRRFGGTGLGLVLSRKLAQLLGGDITLQESWVGQGSNFLVTIDLGESSEVHYGESSVEMITAPPATPVNIDLSGHFILVVDDSPENQVLLQKFLTVAGARVDVADNGVEGVSKALTNDYTLILMDLQMPELDGYHATAQLRAAGYIKPIIALTAHAMKEDRRRCLDGGFDDHLTKPIDRRTLLLTLAEYNAASPNTSLLNP